MPGATSLSDWQSGAWASLAGDEWGHNTKERSGIHGMTYMYQRWYSAETGTFLSKAPYQPMNEHQYGFAQNNTLYYVDADGRHPVYVALAGCSGNLTSKIVRGGYGPIPPGGETAAVAKAVCDCIFGGAGTLGASQAKLIKYLYKKLPGRGKIGAGVGGGGAFGALLCGCDALVKDMLDTHHEIQPANPKNQTPENNPNWPHLPNPIITTHP